MGLITEIEEIQQTINQWMDLYYAQGAVFVLTVVAIVYLYINCEDMRNKFLIPIVVMMLLIWNPILYKYIFSKVVYWRLFWLLPNTILIATALIILFGKQKKIWTRLIIIVGAFLLITTNGVNVFANGGFSIVSNWEKVSQETIDVCEIMLTLDDEPKALIHSSIFNEVRQYAPEIKMMYGRDVHGYIRWSEYMPLCIFYFLEADQVDYYAVMDYVIKEKYNFVVLPRNMGDVAVFEGYGFVEVGRTKMHVIYFNEEM